MQSFRERRPLCGLAVLLCVGWLTAQAGAHELSVSFLELTIRDSLIVVRHRLPMAEMDLLFGIDADLDGRYDREEIQGKLGDLQKYVNGKLSLQVDGQPVGFDPQRFELWGDEEDHLFVDFRADVPAPRHVKQIRFESQLFQELVANHKTMVTVQAGGATTQYALDASNRIGTWTDDRAGGLQHFGRFLALGIEHIFTGYDHVLFLFGLLLLGGTLLEIVKIVTSFTIAHSLTLGLATLGHASPNPTLIEAGIAFSIAYVGLEDLTGKQLTRRWHITFFFGLVHGFGFASVLRDMNLSARELAASLFAFNLGVEVGQVAIVAIALPVLMGMRRLSWHHIFLKGASTMVLAFGVFWLVQRLSGW